VAAARLAHEDRALVLEGVEVEVEGQLADGGLSGVHPGQGLAGGDEVPRRVERGLDAVAGHRGRRCSWALQRRPGVRRRQRLDDRFAIPPAGDQDECEAEGQPARWGHERGITRGPLGHKGRGSATSHMPRGGPAMSGCCERAGRDAVCDDG
jgi:hypothetical protein